MRMAGDRGAAETTDRYTPSVHRIYPRRSAMNKLCWLSVAVLSAVATTALAEDYDGKKPMICAPEHGHDCLPTEKTCKPLKPEAGRDVNLYIDVAHKTIKSPYRTALLP